MKPLNELKKKKTVTSVFKKLSIGDLEFLSKVNSKKLKESIRAVLSAKTMLRDMQDKYSNL